MVFNALRKGRPVHSRLQAQKAILHRLWLRHPPISTFSDEQGIWHFNLLRIWNVRARKRG